jgi:Type II secretion system (T2SS), protein M subtype b
LKRPSPALLSRALALAILAAAMAVALLSVIIPVQRVVEAQQETMRQSLKLLAAYRKAAAERQGLERNLKEIRAAPGAVAGLVDGATTPLAAAKMQSEVKRIIEAHGGEIRSAQNLPSSVAGGFEQIAIRYDITLPMAALGQIAYEIETHKPYFFIDGVDIRAPETAPLGDKRGVDPELAVRWDIRAYRRSGGP